ncbi:MAG: hypothetical protein JWL76_606 [Thermoleophilia bacterium]|nr:hypothetical protein [Thermoleophilia bacterium]
MTQGGHDRGPDAATSLQEPPIEPARDPDVEARDEAEIARALGGDVDTIDRGITTRALLSEIASREPHAVRRAERDRVERRFVRWLLASLLLACVALLAALWWLDPISVTGRQTRFSVVENGGVRQAKLDLMEELPAAPDVLVLGSSRSMKLDPAEIERATNGATAFNGAVSGGTSQDMYLYARYADQLWGGGGGSPDEYPHLVIGVVNDVLRFTGTAALDPRLKQFLPQEDRDRDPLEVTEQLLQIKTVEAAVRAARRVIPRDGVGALLDPTGGATEVDAGLATTGKQKGNQRENLDARGMQLFDPGANYSKPLDQRVETQMTTFVQRSYEADQAYQGVDPRGLDLLRRTIELANEHGDVPTLWVTPYQPGAKQYLPDAYQDRDRAFRAAIKELQGDKNLRFTFVDLDDLASFDGDPNEFHDGIHMTVKNTARVIARLQRDGVLAPARR